MPRFDVPPSESGEKAGPARRRASLGWRGWLLISHWALMFVGTHWPDVDRFRPDEGWPIPYLDQAAHLVLYTVWGALWWVVLRNRPGGVCVRTLWWVVIGGFCYACFDELTQLIVGRTAAFDDLLIDIIGVNLGVWVPETVRRFRVMETKREAA
ncbi:MAG: VanZ family protein [Phycisphaerales bacterium]|nr:MAG: VanZ family protein [Phycisphaerales bacterium]